MRIAPILIALTATALIVVWLGPETTRTPRQASPPATRTSDGTSESRALSESTPSATGSAAGSERQPVESEAVTAQVPHDAANNGPGQPLGPLDSDALAVSRSKLENSITSLKRKLASLQEQATAEGTSDLEAEYRLRQHLRTRECQLLALERGDYETFEQDKAPTHRGSSQDITRVESSPRFSHGRWVEIVWTLDHARYPSLRAAYDDQIAAYRQLAGPEIDRFNALPYEQRKQILEAYSHQGSGSGAARGWFEHVTDAGGLRVDSQRCTVTLAERR